MAFLKGGKTEKCFLDINVIYLPMLMLFDRKTFWNDPQSLCLVKEWQNWIIWYFNFLASLLILFMTEVKLVGV